jgi:heme exporter protein A
MTYLLSFSDLAIARGDRVLLRGLRGTVTRGQILHLRGRNGSGKTTLLEVLGGLRAAEAGTVERHAETADCHWIGHRNALNPSLSPEENLKFWCALQDVPATSVSGVLQRFGLDGAAARPCRELSAGQNRRAALARLLLQSRPLWLLDEPLSALDDAGVALWLDLLREHCANGGGAVITSHQALPEDLPGLRKLELVA